MMTSTQRIRRAGPLMALCLLILMFSAQVMAQSTPPVAQTQKLIASDGTEYAKFGGNVLLHGNTLFVGARYDNQRRGAVYVYTNTGGTWTESQKLTAADSSTDAGFGGALAAENDTLLVGASGDNSNQGAVYVFIRSGSTWTQAAKIVAGDGQGDGGQLMGGDQFGTDLALSGTAAMIGAPGREDGKGAVYSYVGSGDTWVFGYLLTASDGEGGQVIDDNFGFALDFDGTVVIVGALGDDVGANGEQGSAYVFTFSNSTWNETAKLTAADGGPGDRFGSAVSLDGTNLLIGAQYDGIGSAYVFTGSGGTWTQLTKITPADTPTEAYFGSSVHLDSTNGLAVVGAWGADSRVGAAYVYTYTGSTPAWTQTEKLSPADGVAEDWFGQDVAIEGGVVIVGADGLNTQRGAVYVFDLNAQNEADGPVVNPGFESELDNWTLKKKSGDKVKCNTETKIFSYSGSCAFMFKGKRREKATLTQVVDISGMSFTTGDLLSVAMWSRANKRSVSATAKLIVKFNDGTKPVKGALLIGGTTGWSQSLRSVTLSSGAVDKVKIQVKFREESGKLYLDDVALTHESEGGGQTLLPIPAAP